MHFASSEHLQNLLCLKCKKYLSYFPINQSFQPHGSICGRCSTDDDVKRNSIYEEIAKLYKFPCCFVNNGCLEHLYPFEVPHHEKFCKYKTYYCPTSSSTKCKWKGLVKDMYDHFQHLHSVYIIRKKGFEVDLVRSYSENYLLNFEEELYIINQSNSSESYSCNIFYIGSNHRSQNYLYRLIFQNTSNKESCVSISSNLNDETVLDKKLVIDALENPTMVTAHIEILKPGNNNDQFEEPQWKLLGEVICPSCSKYMLPSVHQCVTGHSICSNCRTSQTECPTCNKEFLDTINLTLENLMGQLIYPCENAGCNYSCKGKYMKKHRSNCTFGKFICPLYDYEDCQEEIAYIELCDHIVKCHYENLLELDTVCTPFKSCGEEAAEDTIEDCFILRYDFRLFKLHFKNEYDEFFWEVQLIGTPTKDDSYEFEIDIVDVGSNKRVCFKKECSSLGDKAEAFTDARFFIFIDLNQIRYAIKEERFTYSVRILAKS